MSKLQNVKGMYDLLPDVAQQWEQIERIIIGVLARYQYQHIRIPLVEKTALFKRSIGDVTDVVEKEMYTVEDRDGEALSLRPEATAGVVRAAIQHGLLHNQTQRLWTIGSMFRYERPQKGRAREFHQVDVEAFGFLGPDVDAEIIAMTRDIWRALGLEQTELQINTLGSAESRAAYRSALIAFYQAHIDVLDEESKDRLERNPLRLLDSKAPEMQTLNQSAPQMRDYLSDDCKAHFEQLCQLLDAMEIDYTINPRLVRGLDYYNRTVFEWVAADGLGAQNTICGGGRYDGLVQQLGGKPIPAIGFGMGMERLMLLLEAQGLLPAPEQPDYFMIIDVPEAQFSHAFVQLDRIRQQVPCAKIVYSASQSSLKSQMKKADKSGAECALILGEQEIEQGVITIKPLRGGDQETMPIDQWIQWANKH